MWLPVRCPECGFENRTEFSDTLIHDLRCGGCGTPLCLFVRKQKFEVLFDLGTRALTDGYAREAVASFAAAQERFFEFYVRAVTLERLAGGEKDFGEVQGALEQTWRHVASQSERQLGMLALAYLLREGRAPEFLDSKALGSDFRNKVVHRGYLPPHAEVEAYAARVFALIDRLLTELGEGATHVELAQEVRFAEHLEGLAPGTTVLFEELPGMFRARRFGGGGVGKTARPAQGPAPAALNDIQKFRFALSERGGWLGR